MCETKDHPNHYRCPENPVARRAAQNRRYAQKVETREATGLADNPVTHPDTHITREQVAQAISRAREVLKQAEDEPVPGRGSAYMPGKRLVLSESERDGWEYATEAGLEMEQAVREAGAAISSRADVLGAQRLAQVGQSEEMRALRPEGFSSAEEYSAFISESKAEVTSEWNRERAIYQKMNSEVADDQERLAHGEASQLGFPREAEREQYDKVAELRQRGRALEIEEGRISMGEGAYDLAVAKVRSDSAREALAEQRSMGPVNGSIPTHPTSNKKAVARVEAALEYYPTDWIDTEQGYTTHYTTSGIFEADYYEDIPLVVRDAKTRTRTTMFGDKQKYFERAYYSHARGHEVVTIDRDSEERRDVAHSTKMPKDSRLLREYWETKMSRGWVEVDHDESDEQATQRGLRDGYMRKRKEIAVKGRKEKSRIIAAELVVSGEKEGCVDAGVSTAIHEYGHRQERINPRVNDLMHTFVARRTTDPETNLRHPLTGYAPTRGRKGFANPPTDSWDYEQRGHQLGKDAEFVREDGFVDHYVGKQTSKDSSEVFSMGMEGVFAGRYGGLVGRAGHRADHEHRDLILGTLATVGRRD